MENGEHPLLVRGYKIHHRNLWFTYTNIQHDRIDLVLFPLAPAFFSALLPLSPSPPARSTLALFLPLQRAAPPAGPSPPPTSLPLAFRIASSHCAPPKEDMDFALISRIACTVLATAGYVVVVLGPGDIGWAMSPCSRHSCKCTVAVAN